MKVLQLSTQHGCQAWANRYAHTRNRSRSQMARQWLYLILVLQDGSYLLSLVPELR